MINERNNLISNFINQNRNTYFYTFADHDWNLNNAPQKDIDERTGLVAYYFHDN